MNEKRQTEQTPLILIVDDDRTMRSLLNLAMEEEGYRVIEAANGEQCLSEYIHFQPDLILLDAVMPDIDGFTCCQKIRSLPGGDRLPILTITVLDDRESVDRAFNAGATDYITKPIHWSVLSQRVRRLLANDRIQSKLTLVEKQLRQQQVWSQLVSQVLEQLVANKDHNLERVLSTIRRGLQASRVLLYQSASQKHWESVAKGYPPIRDFSTTDVNSIVEYGEQYQQEQTIVIEDVSQANLPSAVIQILRQLNAQSLAIISIKKEDRFIGSLWIGFSGVFPQDRLPIARLLDLRNLLVLNIEQLVTNAK